jgi:hypothetical protein
MNQNYASIGYKLGDCSVTNKTLVISIGEYTETVTLNKKYGELVNGVPTAYYSDDTIISEINGQLSHCSINKNVKIRRIYFDDEVELVYNNSDNLILHDRALKRDNNEASYANAVTMTTSNSDVICGIAAEPISPHSYGYMIKRYAQRIWLCVGNEFNLSNVGGKYYAAGGGGSLREVSNRADAFLFGTDNDTLDWI